MGGEDGLLSEGLGVRVVAGKVFSVREGFVSPGMALAVEDDAGGAGVNEAANAVTATGGEDVLRAEDVGSEVRVPRAPYAGFGGDVKDGFATGDGAVHCGGVGEVARKDFDAAGGEGRLVRAGKGTDGVAAGEAELHEGLAEEAAAAGDEDFHGKRKEEEPQITQRRV